MSKHERFEWMALVAGAAIAFFGLLFVCLWMAAGIANLPDTCKERRPFSVGNSTLGVSGTYCADD